MIKKEKFILLKDLIYTLKNVDQFVEIKESTLLKDLNLDSLDIVELQVMYEEKTGKEIADPDKPLLTVKDLLNLL